MKYCATAENHCLDWPEPWWRPLIRWPPADGHVNRNTTLRLLIPFADVPIVRGNRAATVRPPRCRPALADTHPRPSRRFRTVILRRMGTRTRRDSNAASWFTLKDIPGRPEGPRPNASKNEPQDQNEAAGPALRKRITRQPPFAQKVDNRQVSRNFIVISYLKNPKWVCYCRDIPDSV